ncbi:MAG: hypothetical protein AAGH78_15115 [Cyanobacteria bacterium P01_H01_bin.58]
MAQFLVSSLSLLSGIFLMLLMTGTVQVLSNDLTGLPNYLKGLVLLGLVISLLGLIVTYGLWALKPWGWLGSLLFQGLCVVNNGLALLAGQHVSAGTYFSVSLCVALGVGLCMPGVRDLFEAAESKSVS